MRWIVSACVEDGDDTRQSAAMKSRFQRNRLPCRPEACAREQLSYTGKGVTVAILDTGLYPHPDLKERITGWYDAVEGAAKPVDPNGHGTQEGGNGCCFFAKLCYSAYNRCLQKVNV